MANANSMAQASQESLWVCGLTPDLFEIPPVKTPIAKTAAAITEMVLDIADAQSSVPEMDGAVEVLELSAKEDTLGGIIDQVLAGWSAAEEDMDFTDRKVLWPEVDPALYRPAASAEQRIADNIAAIKLVQQLTQEGRKPDPMEAAVLLRYSGWGGAARVFSPDGSQPQPLAPMREELRSLVGDRNFAAMQSSVNSAFYTDPLLVQSLWRIVQKLGFKGGRVVEPSSGVGHMITGMPSSLAAKSEITAIEVDPTSAGLLERNFAPYGVEVHACGIEEAKIPAGFYDLVIGNVPFGKYRSNDTSKAAYADWNIHNYFLGKSLDLVRPGGLMVLITTRSSLDSKTDVHRKWLAAHAELLGAFRLPTMAFEGFAHTQAVTDILVLRRRDYPDYSAVPSWIATSEVPQALMSQGQAAKRWVRDRNTGRSYEKTAGINGYYLHHSDHVLGKVQWQSGQYGDEALPVFDGSMEDLSARLNSLIERDIPQGIYSPRTAMEDAPMGGAFTRYDNHGDSLPGAFVLNHGAICISEGDELIDVDSLYQGTVRKRLLGMMDIRDAAVAVIEHQARSEDDAQLQLLQQHLNRTYDGFVAAMGFLSTTANSRVMRSDPNWPLMLALEIWDEEENTATKADIFTKRTVGKVTLPEKVGSTKDAMLLSLAIYGRIVLKDMSLRVGLPVMEVVKQLKAEGLAYRDPALARWVPADEYLSGNIREKIAQAKAAGPAYESNIPALEAVLPSDLGPAEVEARLGAPWIPVDVIKQFATELVNDRYDVIAVKYDETTATWSVDGGYRKQYVGDHTLQNTKWGTKKRCALELLEGALNQQPPTVTFTSNGTSRVDTTATLDAREKWQAIRDHFRQWVYRDESRRDRLLRIYNDLFNQIVPRRFDGSHLHLPGMTAEVVPYPHQKDAIWRIVVNGNTLLAHCVGAGKTLTMIAAGMELRRLGKARKPLHVVMNNCLEQYVGEAKRLYPQARILMASKEDLSGDKRRTFCARIATGDWDAIVMTQATFERIMLSPETQKAFIDNMLSEARMNLSRTKDANAKRSIKELERRMKDYEAKLKRLVETGKADERAVWFEELGVDYVFLDEAHAYKNLGRLSKMPRVAGLPNVNSQRAFDTFMKTRLIMDLHGGAEEGVVMATATPITNSLAELHTTQVYLQPQTLKKYGIYEFDAWSASFGESVTGIELAPDGSGFRTNTRYAKFVNLPELMAIFKGVADIRTKEMLALPTPQIVGGKPQTMAVASSEVLKELTADLVERADRIRSRAVNPKDDNFLAVTNDGRRAALDVRLVDASLPFDPNGKLACAARNIFRIWEEGASKRVAQLVFSDLGTPGGKGFSVYGEIKRLLVEMGIPSDQIEFVQDHDSDAAKAKVFKKVRDGVVRVLLGSTQKMGTGTNVQTRLKAIHQIDAPWVPSAVEQRDGRADRQGNECESIELWRYVTEGSFDAYSWQLLDVKARFINQVMTADQGMRSVEDISMAALTYAEIKAIASGNPLVMEKAKVDLAVQKFGRSYDQWEEDRWRMGRRRADIKKRLTWIDDNMTSIEAVAAQSDLVTQSTPFDPLSRAADDAVMPEMATVQSIGSAVRAVARQGVGLVGEVGGFRIDVDRFAGTVEVLVTTPDGRETATCERPALQDTDGLGRAVLETIASFKRKPAQLREEYGRKCEELAGIEQMLNESFPHQEELDAALQRQREIEAELDLDKADLSAQTMDAEAD